MNQGEDTDSEMEFDDRIFRNAQEGLKLFTTDHSMIAPVVQQQSSRRLIKKNAGKKPLPMKT